jgi:Tn3 transposase DDE domain-containing protein
MRDRRFSSQRHHASGLNLVVAAIILWNTVYLDRAVTFLRKNQEIDENLLTHLSPLGWSHINLTGDHAWNQDAIPKSGGYRPLRAGKNP